ncbi:MAG TPA: phytanoyl-CoA dioxygenase family protein [Burkholderiaceae bacterium]|nr:phytanoyl-CoA dioxygenase family protein [Burkholderiaceae bacterium]
MSLLQRYEQDGYVIVPDLIPHAKVDAVVERLERFKRGRRPYWSESIHKWILPPLDERGYMEESMENLTRLWFSGGLNRAGSDLLLGPEIHRVLKQLKPDKTEFVHWLNHLFDKSTGSIDHVDNWYLDSDPAGELIGAWVALEDIHPDSGTFRVFPKSHLMPGMAELWSLDHDAFIKHCAGLAEKLQPLPIVIKKGTVVFFHPLILHGATDQRDPSHSRKSLTGHYLPFGALRKERFEQKDTPQQRLAREMREARKVGGRPIMVSHTLRDELLFNLRGVASFAKALALGPTPVTMDMKRRAYANN